MIVGPNADSITREKGGTVTKEDYILSRGLNFSALPLPANLATTCRYKRHIIVNRNPPYIAGWRNSEDAPAVGAR